jgi:putative ABC transport system ATP-binding protein
MSLRLSGVGLRRGDGDETVRVLDEVSLTVAPGELVALVGPSGSGKSSLLAVAGALIQPDTGTVEIHGTALADLSANELARVRRREIGFVFQSANLVPSLTAIDQLLAIAHLDGRRPRAERERARELLDVVGLAAKADRRPHQLSGGERQRVGVARALFNEPTVLLADEPTSALDRARSAELSALLATLTRERGVAAVVATHDDVAVAAATRTVAMEDGRLLATDRAAEIAPR